MSSSYSLSLKTDSSLSNSKSKRKETEKHKVTLLCRTGGGWGWGSVRCREPRNARETRLADRLDLCGEPCRQPPIGVPGEATGAQEALLKTTRGSRQHSHRPRRRPAGRTQLFVLPELSHGASHVDLARERD